MNHRNAKEGLFDASFLLGAFRRKAALKWLIEQGDAEAVGILVDAVERKGLGDASNFRGASRYWRVPAARRFDSLGFRLVRAA